MKKQIRQALYRVYSTQEVGVVYWTITIIEWLFLVIIVDKYGSFQGVGTDSDGDIFLTLYFPTIIVALQSVQIYVERGKAGYAKYILRRTFPPEKKAWYIPKGNLVSSIDYFDSHLKAIRRGITRNSGGNFAPLFRITQREKANDELSFNDLTYALRINLINEASKLPKDDYFIPFKRYYDQYQDIFGKETPSFKSWIGFLFDKVEENKAAVMDEVYLRQKNKQSRKIRKILSTKDLFWVNLKDILYILLIITFIIVIILGLLGWDTSKINSPF